MEGYTCKDCKVTYPSAEEFSNHFTRGKDKVEIIGCKERDNEKIREA